MYTCTCLALIRSSSELLRDAERGAASLAAKLASVEAELTIKSDSLTSLTEAHALLESAHNALLASSVALSDELSVTKLDCAAATTGLQASDADFNLSRAACLEAQETASAHRVAADASQEKLSAMSAEITLLRGTVSALQSAPRSGAPPLSSLQHWPSLPPAQPRSAEP